MSNKAIGTLAIVGGVAFVAVGAGQAIDGHPSIAFGLWLAGLIGITAGLLVGGSKDGN